MKCKISPAMWPVRQNILWGPLQRSLNMITSIEILDIGVYTNRKILEPSYLSSCRISAKSVGNNGEGLRPKEKSKIFGEISSVYRYMIYVKIFFSI